jgi:hypothetical protein
MDELKECIGKRVVIVADDKEGFGGKTKYVGQRGIIVGWRLWKYGRLPVIKLDRGETISDKNIWWQYER